MTTISNPKRLDKVRCGNFEHLVGTQPAAIVGELIDEPTLIYDDGSPRLGYFILPGSLLRDIRKVVRGTQTRKGGRTSGLPSQSTVYGVVPRDHLRVDYCRFSVASRAEAPFFRTMNHYCELLCELYEKHFPESYAGAMAEIETLSTDWRHNKTPFQTININVNHAIKYHRDAGNLRSAHSTVLIVRDGISGGELPIPEYDLTLLQQDGAFTIFDGQTLLHGVLPIKRVRPQGYRASIVFYSMNDLKNCYPFQDEIDRLAAREQERAPTRYSLERKKNLIRMNQRILKRINSPYLKWIEDEK